MFLIRPSWDDTWLAVADVVSRRSRCTRDQVGAVIVDDRNRIVATGYNGPPAGMKFTDSDGDVVTEVGCGVWCPRVHMAQSGNAHGLALDYSDCYSLHAEANALSVCDRSVREGGTIYVTSGICFGCAKLIANSGLTHVTVRPSMDTPYRNCDKSYELIMNCGLQLRVSGE